MGKNIVVIGAGVGGVSFMETLIQLKRQMKQENENLDGHADWNVYLITASPHIKRPRDEKIISKTLSLFDIEEQGMDQMRQEYEANIVHAAASRIIEEEDGKKYLALKSLTEERENPMFRLRFDYCCIAIGGKAQLPKAVSLCLNSPHHPLHKYLVIIRDVDSVERLKKLIAESRQIALVGNGGIAMELVNEVKQCQIVWIIKDEHIGHAFFDKETADFLYECKMREWKRNSLKKQTGRAEEVGESRTHDISIQRKHEDKQLYAPLADSLIETDAASSTGAKFPGAALGPDWVGQADNVLYGSSQKRPKLVASAENHQVITKFKSEISQISCPNDHENGYAVHIELSTGETVDCDMIICATGVVPYQHGDSGFIEYESLKTNANRLERDEHGAILVEPGTLHSSAPGIYAIGDCSKVRESQLSYDNNWFQMRLWSQARKAGICAAQAIASELVDEINERLVSKTKEKHEILEYQTKPLEKIATGLEYEMFAHATRFFGLKVILLGRYNFQGLNPTATNMLKLDYGENKHPEPGSGEEDSGPKFIRLALQDGYLRGAILIGETGLEETYENLILSQLPVDSLGENLVNPSMDLEDYFD